MFGNLITYLNQSAMNALKRAALWLTACLLACFLLQGCKFFTEGTKALKEYCPGLKVNINGVSWMGGTASDVYILKYDRSFEKRVYTYFADKSNGFSNDNSRGYLDIKDGEDRAVADGDSVVSKKIEKGKQSATVVFNRTTGIIIIIKVREK